VYLDARREKACLNVGSERVRGPQEEDHGERESRLESASSFLFGGGQGCAASCGRRGDRLGSTPEGAYDDEPSGLIKGKTAQPAKREGLSIERRTNILVGGPKVE